ncbi:Actin filament-associated protein 1 [Galemys pyrenaicus]|uniref:Actin filament-associated protein 1 n=1 Tax=Galemys pyrenaicus TaxID=202257 RepID=A0A8J6AC64_GALPY|nr:Actin filament-associated protein 1 [Galemys pyrenaicus]
MLDEWLRIPPLAPFDPALYSLSRGWLLEASRLSSKAELSSPLPLQELFFLCCFSRPFFLRAAASQAAPPVSENRIVGLEQNAASDFPNTAGLLGNNNRKAIWRGGLGRGTGAVPWAPASASARLRRPLLGPARLSRLGGRQRVGACRHGCAARSTRAASSRGCIDCLKPLGLTPASSLTRGPDIVPSPPEHRQPQVLAVTPVGGRGVSPEALGWTYLSPGDLCLHAPGSQPPLSRWRPARSEGLTARARWPQFGFAGPEPDAMEELIVELRLFLELLDHEYLTSTVREKKAVITDILLRIQSSRGLEVKDHTPKPEAPGSLPAPPQMPLPEIPQPWLPPDSGPPPLPTSSLPEGYYEEAVPLSPGKAPEYITSNYDSDAMSSSYESYDEEEEDGKGKATRHQWPSEEASMDLVRDAKICAFLLRKKRFGQWTKLLCVVKDTKMLVSGPAPAGKPRRQAVRTGHGCYKSSKDQQPQMELPLQGSSVTYTPRDGKKKRHELKITQQGTDPLVLAVQSKEQAEQWLKVRAPHAQSSPGARFTAARGFFQRRQKEVIRDVYSSSGGPADPEGAPCSGSPVPKAELEKKLSSERPSSDGEAVLENGAAPCDGGEQVKRKKSTKAEAKGTVSRVTGKKITKIMGLGKKKPSTDEQTSSAEEDVPTCGHLNVLSNSRWRERWCRVKDGALVVHKDRTDLKAHVVAIPLRGCEVIPGLDSRHPLTFRLLRHGQEVAVLEASSSEDMGRWIGILLAEAGSCTDPGALHYDYIDVEMSASVIQTAKQTFWRGLSTSPYLGSASNGYAHPSGTALHYEDAPCVDGLVSARPVPTPAAAAPPWAPDDGLPASRRGGRGEEVLYDNAGLYDNLPSPKIFARCLPADRKAAGPPADKAPCNRYRRPGSCSPPRGPTNTSSAGRASLGPGSQPKGEKRPAAANGVPGKAKTLSAQQRKAEAAASVRRTPSNAGQCKYGKSRVEADARRLRGREEELLRRKEGLRGRLAQLRKERRDLRAAIEANAGRKTQAVLEDKLKRLEGECQQKEAERVSLELELTEVKESLQKALAGGVTLGLAIEPRSATSSPQSPVCRHRVLESSPLSSCETSDAEGPMPVNSAAGLRKGPPAAGSSPCRGHVLRKAKEWELKNGT